MCMAGPGELEICHEQNKTHPRSQLCDGTTRIGGKWQPVRRRAGCRAMSGRELRLADQSGEHASLIVPIVPKTLF